MPWERSATTAVREEHGLRHAIGECCSQRPEGMADANLGESTTEADPVRSRSELSYNCHVREECGHFRKKEVQALLHERTMATAEEEEHGHRHARECCCQGPNGEADAD